MRPIPSEMISPSIHPRIEKAHRGREGSIEPCNVIELVAVAVRTCEGEIGRIIIPAMLAGDDVIANETKLGITRRKTTIFALMLGSFRNQRAMRIRHRSGAFFE